MTPKEKAADLVDKMYFSRRYRDGEDYIPEQAWSHAKQQALIAVDAVVWSRKDDSRFDDTLMQTSTHYITPHPMYLTYWLKVKEEIEKL